MPLALVAFAFDPYLRIGDRAVRLETIGVAVAVLVGLVGAAIALRGVRRREAVTAIGAIDAAPVPRFDDLLLIVLAAIPGAVIGGRVGYALIHLDYYATSPGALLDPTQGSLELGLAVVGGALTAAVLVRILDRGLGTWLHIAAVPLLGALAIGKIAAALGGTGQGAFADGTMTTAYVGVGPWGSLGAEMPAIPSQLVEGLLAIVAVVIVAALGSIRRPRAPDGRLFSVALGLWALGRFAVAFTWRDAQIAGPLDVDQLISLAIAVTALLAWLRLYAVSRSRRFEIDERLPAPLSLTAADSRSEDR